MSSLAHLPPIYTEFSRSALLTIDPIQNVIADWIRWISILIAIIFTVNMVINLAQAQFASFMNVPRMRAQAIEQAGFAVVMVAIAACATQICNFIGALLTSSGDTFGSVSQLWVGLAQFGLSLILGVVVAATFLYVAWNVLEAQLNSMLGRPGAVSQAILNLVAILLGGLACFASIPLSSWLLGMIFST